MTNEEKANLLAINVVGYHRGTDSWWEIVNGVARPTMIRLRDWKPWENWGQAWKLAQALPFSTRVVF